jgi:glycosyltransferase involved in cell wall biosynthesis
MSAQQRIRVRFVTDRLVPRLGMERALEELVLVLQVDHDVQVLTIAGEASPPRIGGVTPTSLRSGQGLAGRVKALGQIRAAVKSEPETTHVAVGLWAAVTCLIATLGIPCQLALWEHSVLPWRLRREPKVMTGAALLRLLGGRLSFGVAVSEATAAALRGLTGSPLRIDVIPNVVESPAPSDPESPPMTLGASGVVLLGIGSLIRRKNWQLAIRSLPHLPTDYRLVIAGSGPDRSRLEALASDLGVGERVSLLGHVEGAARLLSQATLVVHPSYAETFGYSIIEAADARRPVVALRMPVMDEFIPRFACGVTCLAASPVAFAQAIQAAAGREFDFEAPAQERRRVMSSDAINRAWGAAFIASRGTVA